jgi:ABC-type antimicrobial peptide transport system permease subunit
MTIAFLDYSDQIRATVVQERLVAILAGFFGGLAMLLAALGLYGVTAYSVHRRRSELAVRMALGASTRGVVTMVLRQVSGLLIVGILAGLTLTLWAAQFIRGLLFRVEVRDPLTLAIAAAVLLASGLLAGWLPARRATRVDPLVALRGE